MTRTRSNRWLGPLVVAALLATLAGCEKGPPLATVKGKVTYGGQPVAYAAVEFRPLGDGKQSVGFSNAEGEYELQYTLRKSGALVGRHTVVVRIYPPEGVKPVPVPAKYSGKPGTELEVEPGRNWFDIELKE